MKKRKKEQPIELIHSFVYSTTFLEYNEEGKIISISNEKILKENVLEIDNDLIKDFNLGNKHFVNYKIDYFFNLKKGIVHEEEVVVRDLGFLHLIPLVDNYKNEITILHKEHSWELKIREDVKYDFPYLTFFVCKTDEPSFLYSTIVFDLHNCEEIKFKDFFEYDLKLISLFTMKKFNSYGIKDLL